MCCDCTIKSPSVINITLENMSLKRRRPTWQRLANILFTIVKLLSCPSLFTLFPKDFKRKPCIVYILVPRHTSKQHYYHINMYRRHTTPMGLRCKTEVTVFSLFQRKCVSFKMNWHASHLSPNCHSFSLTWLLLRAQNVDREKNIPLAHSFDIFRINMEIATQHKI